MSYLFSQKKVRKQIKDIAEELNIDPKVVEAVVRSQFECAREATQDKKNIRFPYLFLLYHRENKNPDYLKHRKKLKNE